jgi:hypothetical protein
MCALALTALAARLVAIVACLLIAGCATQSPQYLRVDGQTADAAQLRAAYAQCKAQGAAVASYDINIPTGPIPWLASMTTSPSRQSTVIDACMARNGYISQ